MPLHSPYNFRERILVFGNAGTGKTTTWLDIAKWLKRSGSESRVYVLDSDFAASRMLSSYPDVNVEVHTALDWQDYLNFRTHVLKNANPDGNDWVVVDFIGTAWQAVQSWYVEQVFGQDIADYFLQVRKELKSGDKSLSAFDGWVDWNVINPNYFRWIRDLFYRGDNRYHILCTAQSDTLSSDRRPTEDANIRALLLPFGVKPKGQKDLPYYFHTVLISGWEQRGDIYMLNTAKDRERAKLQGAPIKSFSIDYLKSIAGWEVG